MVPKIEAVPTYSAALQYASPLKEGANQSCGGLKRRICMVDPSLDRRGLYSIAGENISSGGAWAWLGEKCLTHWYWCVMMGSEKLLLNANSARARLGLDSKAVEAARECDKTHRNYEALSKLVQEKLGEIKQNLREHPQINFDGSCIHPLRLHEVEFLGAHNACLNEEEGWDYNQQHWALRKQLDNGVRVIELDVAADQEGILQICHGTAHRFDPLKLEAYQTCTEKLSELKRWMEANPKEVLIVKVDNSRDALSDMDAIDRCIEEAGLAPLMYTPDDLEEYDRRHEGYSWPTVGALLQENKRIVMTNAKLNEKESRYTHFAGNVLEEVGADNAHPAFKSVRVADQTSRYPARAHKLRFLNYSTPVSNETLVKLLKIISPLLYCLQPLASRFTNKLNDIPKITQDLLDNKPEAVDGLADQLTAFCGGRPMVPLMDFVDQYISGDGLTGINGRNQALSTGLFD